MEKKQYLCTRFWIKEQDSVFIRLGEMGEWLKPTVC